MNLTKQEKNFIEKMRKRSLSPNFNCSEHDSIEEHISAFEEYFEGEFERNDMIYFALQSCDNFDQFEIEVQKIKFARGEGDVDECIELGLCPENTEYVRWTFDFGDPRVNSFFYRNKEGFLASKFIYQE